MNFSLYKWITLFVVCVFAQGAYADLVESITLPEPGKICFQQSTLHAEWVDGNYRMDQIMISHFVRVPENDHFKRGHVFVGFRLKSQPDKL
ncbi:MAG: hypothetical protein RQ714_02940 [Nitrosomonas sp.]|nr:hypothetical protein [Nitrosomonas sp.]